MLGLSATFARRSAGLGTAASDAYTPPMPPLRSLSDCVSADLGRGHNYDSTSIRRPFVGLSVAYQSH